MATSGSMDAQYHRYCSIDSCTVETLTTERTPRRSTPARHVPCHMPHRPNDGAGLQNCTLI